MYEQQIQRKTLDRVLQMIAEKKELYYNRQKTATSSADYIRYQYKIVTLDTLLQEIDHEFQLTQVLT